MTKSKVEQLDRRQVLKVILGRAVVLGFQVVSSHRNDLKFGPQAPFASFFEDRAEGFLLADQLDYLGTGHVLKLFFIELARLLIDGMHSQIGNVGVITVVTDSRNVIVRIRHDLNLHDK